MRTFIFGMLALLGSSGFTQADVVLTAGSNGTTGQVGALSSLSIKFETLASRNALSTLNFTLDTLSSFSDTVGWTLNTGAGGATLVAQGVNATIVNGTLDFGGTPEFGAGTYWLNVSNIEFANYRKATTATYSTSDNTWINAASMVTGNGSNTDITDLNNSFGSVLTVSVPEPGTLLLGGIAAISGGGGVWWKRRRKGAGNSAAIEPSVN